MPQTLPLPLPLPLPPLGWPADPAFRLATSDLLAPANADESLPTWRHLCSLLARDRNDLESHTRRILLACQPALADRVDGAMIDLFLALGAHGASLKTRLLTRAEAWLEPALLATLRRHLDTALPAGMPLSNGSMLGHDTVGSLNLVTRERSVQAAETPLQQAVAMLEDGDLGGAARCLEATLLDQPDDAAVLHELLAVYHHQRDTAAPAELQARLLARHGRLPAGWA